MANEFTNLSGGYPLKQFGNDQIHSTYGFDVVTAIRNALKPGAEPSVAAATLASQVATKGKTAEAQTHIARAIVNNINKTTAGTLATQLKSAFVAVCKVRNITLGIAALAAIGSFFGLKSAAQLSDSEPV